MLEGQPNAERAASAAPPRRRKPWLIAAGFLLALAATVATVILTGLYVRASDDPGRGSDRSPWRAEGDAPRETERLPR